VAVKAIRLRCALLPREHALKKKSAMHQTFFAGDDGPRPLRYLVADSAQAIRIRSLDHLAMSARNSCGDVAESKMATGSVLCNGGGCVCFRFTGSSGRRAFFASYHGTTSYDHRV